METMTVKEIIEAAGIKEPFYPGKKIVVPLRQAGEYKSHCIVYDWHDPDKIKIEVKAGLSGKNLAPKELAKYPVSLQVPTIIEFDVSNATRH